LVNGQTVHENKGGALALIAFEPVGNAAGDVMHHQRRAGRIIENAAVVGGEPSVELLVGKAAQFRELLLKLGAFDGADLRPEHSGLRVAVGEREPVLGRGVFVWAVFESRLLPNSSKRRSVFSTLLPSKPTRIHFWSMA
jgi:hypothetical protein